MRDIRDDLRERVAVLEKEQKELEKRLEAVQAQREALRSLLEDEEARWRQFQSSGPQEAPSHFGNGHPVGLNPLAGLVYNLLSDGDVWLPSQLTSAAIRRDFPFGQKSPGRVVHAACLSLLREGLAEQAEGGWRKTK